MQLVSAASKFYKNAKARGLKGCTVYATGEPCPMCSVALALIHISELVIAASYTDVPGQMQPGRKRPGKVTYKEIFREYGLKVKVKKGVLREKVVKLYEEFVKKH